MVPRRRPALAATLLALVAASAGCGSGSAPRRTATARAQTTTATTTTAAATPSVPPVPAAVAREPLARRVARLFLVGAVGTLPTDPGVTGLARREWGGVVLGAANGPTPAALAPLAAAVLAQAQTAHLAAPLIVADPRGLGPAPRTAAAARAAAAALHGAGIGAVLGPSADVGVPAGPLSGVTLGQSPARVARAAAAVARAYAGAGVRPVPGQFPGAGSANVDPDEGEATVGESLGDLRRRDLVPFRRLARRVGALQLTNASYAAYDGVSPAVLLPDVATDLLRGTLRFRGAAVSPDLGATTQATNEPMGQVAVEALKAGCDVLYISGPPADERAAYAAVLKAAASGAIPAARLNAALGRAVAFTRGR